MVWTAVSTRKVQPVVNAKAFANVAKECCKTSITLITANEINKTSEALDLDQCFKRAKGIPRISKFHCMYAVQPGTMKFLTHSYQKTGIEMLLGESDDESEYSGEEERCSSNEDDNNGEGKCSAEDECYGSQEETTVMIKVQMMIKASTVERTKVVAAMKKATAMMKFQRAQMEKALQYNLACLIDLRKSSVMCAQHLSYQNTM
ncbi:hypothetical protein QZH41_003330 [Actinostola sp. cb2023]|nr:hypothetical protein QZH41_003330 [Actinostola sp. cb2023]